METETKVLKFLLETEKSLTIREISAEIGSDYKITHTAINRLISKKLVESRRLGKSCQITLLRKLSLEIIRAEFERRESILSNDNLRILYDKLDSLPFLFIAILFGSFIKGKVTKHSDIDLIILAAKETEKKIEQVISFFPLKIHPTFLSYEEFLDMANSKKFSVVSEAIKKNVILIGIEDYYRLIQNVGQK